MSKQRTLLYILIGLLWPLAVLVMYYATHKPFGPELAVKLAGLIWQNLTVFFLVSLAGGIGCRLARLRTLHQFTRLSLQAGLGLGILGLVVLLLGTTAGLPRWLLWVLLLALWIVFFRSILDWWREWSAWQIFWQESDGFGKAVGWMLGLILLAAWVITLAPPVKFDALLYHLTLPAAYLRLGRISDLPWIVMSGHPQTTEMLYTWAMALGGSAAAATLGWTFSLFTTLGLLGYLRQRLNPRAAWAGAASLLCGYTLAIATSWAYVDWLGLFFGLGCLVAFDLWRNEGSRNQLWLAGAFAGLAFSTKYTAGVLGLVSLGALAWHCWRRKTAYLPALIQFGLAAAVFALPWLVKNLINTGNPLYPFFFSSGAMDELRIAVYQGLPPGGNWLDFFLLPLRATVMGVDGAEGYSVSIGPLLLGLGALAWVGSKNHTAEQRGGFENAVLLGLLGLLVWAVGNRFSGYLIQTRLYFSLFPAFAVLAAYGFWGLNRLSLPALRFGRILAALVMIVLALNVLEISVAGWKMGAPQAALGLTSESDYRASNLGWFEPAMQAVRDLPEGSKVQLIYEPRSFYCAPTCYPDEILDRWKVSLNRQQDPIRILENWKADGFTHIMVYKAGVDFLRTANDPHHPPSDLQALDEFLNLLPDPVDFGGVYELYPLSERR